MYIDAKTIEIVEISELSDAISIAEQSFTCKCGAAISSFRLT